MASSEAAGTVTGLVREVREGLLVEWERLHRERFPDVRLSREELRGSLPALLEDIATAVDAGSPEGVPQALARQTAADHARRRLERGFSLEEVSTEYALLRRLTLQALLPGGRLGLAAQVALNEAFDGAVALAISAYTRATEVRLETQLHPFLHPDEARAGAPSGVVRPPFFALSRDLLAVSGLDGFFKRVNPAFMRTLGWSEEELLARPFFELVHPEDVPATRAELEKLGEGVPTQRFENRYRCKDGTWRWLSWTTTPVPEEGLVYAVARDVSEEKRREEAQWVLVEAGEALTFSLDYEATLATMARLVVPALADWCVVDVMDSSGRLQRVAVEYDDPAQTQVAEVLRRYPPTTPAHPTLRALSEGRPTVISEVTDAVLQQMARGPEHAEALRAMGVKSYLAVPLVARGERLGALTFISTRVDRRYLTQEVLLAEEIGHRAALAVDNARLFRQAQEARAFFHAMLQCAPLSILGCDTDGTLRFFNTAAERMLGYRAEEVVGRTTPVDFLAAEESQARSFEALVAGARHGLFEEREGTCLRKDGGRFPVRLTVTAVRGVEEELLGFMVLAEDLTDERRLEAEGRARSEFEQQLIGIVSHDLRNPLNTILLGARVLLRQPGLEERQALALTRMVTSAERAARMIRDLLDFTQARLGGGIPVERSPLDVHAFTRQVVEEVQVGFPERQVWVEHEGEGWGEVDSDRLAQVVTNLLMNALKYSPEGTPVRVRTRGETGWVHLEVHNGGEPIPEELQARIFEPMQRGSHAGGGSDRSVGLGLYIVRHIVRAHGGSIELRSLPGEGTTFTVRLPRRVVP
jgi:PAS domain S-box-containing protein